MNQLLQINFSKNIIYTTELTQLYVLEYDLSFFIYKYSFLTITMFFPNSKHSNYTIYLSIYLSILIKLGYALSSCVHVSKDIWAKLDMLHTSNKKTIVRNIRSQNQKHPMKQ